MWLDLSLGSIVTDDSFVTVFGSETDRWFACRICICNGYTELTGRKRMTQAVLKWGNSLGLRIPSAIAKQMGIEEGTELELRVEGQRMVVERADALPEYSRGDLVRPLRKSKGALIDFGRPRGNEVL